MVIFDNVEDLDVIKDLWVESIHGSYLITTRSKHEHIYPIKSEYQVPYMTEEEGCNFVMSVAQQDSTSRENIESARELCRLLDGLPLAMIVMAL